MSASPLPRLVCFGNLTVDDVVLPDGSSRPGCMGGDALYAALGGRLWEPAVEMVAPVGIDLPDAVSDGIVRAGFSLAGLPKRPIPTIHNEVRYDAEGGRVWTAYSAEHDFHVLSPRPDDVPSAYLHARAVLVAAMSLEAQETLVSWLRSTTGATIALDLQEDYIAGNEDRLESMIRSVDIFMPSEEEVRRLLGHEDWPRAARFWAGLGPHVVVIKRGASGSLVYDARTEAVVEVPAFPGAVVDTTGAGDTYCGGFLATFVQTPADLTRAARTGAISASFAVQGFGMAALLDSSPQAAVDRLDRWVESEGRS